MNRTAFAICLAISFAASSQILAQDNKIKKDTLDVRKIVLFNAGIGYFQHHGQVDGDATVSLPFATEDIDDLLKTLVMQDAKGGRFWVDYDAAQSGADKAGIQLSNAPTFGELLQQLRGEEIEAEDSALQGTIFGLELKNSITSSGNTIEEEYLNLLTPSGIKSLPLKSFSSIKFKDPELQKQLAKALASVAATRRDGKRTLRFRFSGAGQRAVQIGYLRRTPVWKTTHRLVMSKKPQIQSWAIIENTGETDWKAVKLSLVGGSPISFEMALEAPRFVQRPVADLPFSGIPMPRVHESGSALAGLDFGGGQRPFVTSVIPNVPSGVGGGGFGGGMGGMMGGGGPFGGGGGEMQSFPTNLSLAVSQKQTAASAGAIGEFYQYELNEPVELDAGRSAMLPIHAAEVDAERLSVYAPDVDDSQLLFGVLLKNDTKSHWAAGPLTIYDDEVYAGEAQLSHCPPGAQRLATFAADLEIEANYEVSKVQETEKGMKLKDGKLLTMVEKARSQTYQFVTLNDEAKTVLIEHLRPDLSDEAWEVAESDVLNEIRLETTESHIRYKLELTAKKPTQVVIKETRMDSNEEWLSRISTLAIKKLLSKPYFDGAAKARLEDIIARRVELEVATNRLRDIGKALSTLERDQSRIRSNMDKLDRNSELYKQYVTKLTGHEEEFQKLRAEEQKTMDVAKNIQAELDVLAPPAKEEKGGSSASEDPFQ